jgi:hypothetical protein
MVKTQDGTVTTTDRSRGPNYNRFANIAFFDDTAGLGFLDGHFDYFADFGVAAFCFQHPDTHHAASAGVIRDIQSGLY